VRAQVRKIVPEDSTLCLDNGLYKVRGLAYPTLIGLGLG
jgi:hypothetical protein